MKRIFSFLLAMVLTFSLAACGKTAEKEPEVNLTAQEVLDAVKKSLGESYTSDTPEEADRMTGFYGLDMSKIESWAAECNSFSLNLDTAVVLKVKEGYADEAAALLQERLEQTASYAQMYNMDLFRVNEARLFVSGNYVGYFIQGVPADYQESEEAQAKQASEEAGKIDGAWKEIFGSAKNLAEIPAPNQNGGLLPPEEDGLLGG